jgi:hypothetical protein
MDFPPVFLELAESSGSKKFSVRLKAKGMPDFYIYPICLISMGFYFIRFIEEFSLWRGFPSK